MEYIEESQKRELTAAWQHGMMSKWDPKKYPKSAAHLWDKNAGDQTPEQMRQLALALASNGSEFIKAERAAAQRK